MQVKIERVYWGEVETKFGKKQKLGIKTNVHGDQWLSCFENDYNSKALRGIQEGQSVDIIVEKKGEYLNFRIPSKQDLLEDRIVKLEAKVFGTGQSQSDDSYPYPGTEAYDGSTVPNPEDTPF